MVTLRFSRDKRGYEHFYIVQSAPTRRGKSPQTQVLYWFRTPPNVRVGREPFDQELRRALETQNPGVIFDWKALIETPIPPPSEPEPWRERRRVEKAAKRAARAEAAAEAEAQANEQAQAKEQAPAELESAPVPDLEPVPGDAVADQTAVLVPVPELSVPGQAFQAKRRRRRRGRSGSRPGGPGETGQAPKV